MWGDSDKKLKLIAIWICAAVLLFMAVGIYVIWNGSRDADPPELGELAWKPKEVAAEDNALTYIEKAVAALVESKPDWTFEHGLRGDLGAWMDGECEIEDEMLEDIMLSNEAAFGWLQRAAGCDEFVVPMLEDPEKFGLDIRGMIELSVLVRAKARWEANHGRYDRAADILIADYRVAGLLQSNASTLMEALISNGSLQQLLPEMVRLGKEEGIAAGTIRRMIQAMREPADLDAGVKSAMKGEYHNTSRILDHMVSSDEGMDQLVHYSSSTDLPDELEFVEGWFFGYRYHPNRTKGLLADYYLEYVSDLPSTHNEALEIGLLKPPDPGKVGWRQLFKPNSLGMDVAHECMMAHYILNRYYVMKFNLASTRVALAALAYRKEQGEYPEKLEALVGDDLKQIPVDCFDGKPMRYDTSQFAIYTVGEDGVDDPNGRDSQKIDLLSEEELAALEEASQPEKPHRGRRRE